MTAHLTHDDHVRLRSWAVTIAEALLPPGAQRQDRGGDWRFSNTGGLSIAKRSGAWYSHAADVGAYSAVRLIELLRSCARAEAEQWAAAWLASHTGTGSCDGAADDAADSQAAAQANAARAKAVINAVVPASGTIAETYLRSRGLEPPYPDCVRYLPDGRIGESALVGLLTAHDVVIGAQLTYLDPTGRKSLREPVRQTFVLDRERAKGAVFMVEKLSGNGRLLLAEGLEDGLSLLTCARPEAIFALPGVGGQKHFPARRGQTITVVRDGDEPGSAADKALIQGVDHLLLQHAEVRVTQTPPAKDANDILCEVGPDALNALVDAATAAELSEDGEVKRLAGLTDPAEYDRERIRIADKFGMRRPTLDAKVTKAKPPHRKGKDEADGNGLVEREPQPWPDPVRLAEVLTTLRDRLCAHVVFRSTSQAAVASLWIAHTYVAERFVFTPRLTLESATPRCGKTTLHDLLGLTVCRPVEADKLTPASLVRMKAAAGPITTLLDEMGDVLRTSPELDGVLRSGFQRGKRYINLKPLPDGGFEHEVHDVFGPVCISLVGALRGALADRAIHLHLRRKPVTKKVAKLRHGRNRQVMLDCGRQLARWAADDADALGDDPSIPEELNDRQADFVVPLLAIADQAGGTWPAEARAALEQLLAEGADRAEDEAILLLHDLRKVFDTALQQQPGLAPEKQEIESAQLVSQLLLLAESPWGQLDSGRPLTQWRLARMLRNFGIGPHQIGAENSRKRGYQRLQFTEAWAAYPPVPFQDPLNQTVQTVQTAQDPENPPVLRDSQTVQDGSAGQFEKSASPRASASLALAGQSGQFESGVLGRNIEKVPPEAKSGNYSGNDFSLHKPQGNDFSAPLETPPSSHLPLGNGTGEPPGTSAAQSGNGAAAPQQVSIGTLIRLLAATHPDWTHERLAKTSGQPVSVVKRTLARTPRSSPAGGLH
jgi:putative DNA primase/helicase